MIKNRLARAVKSSRLPAQETATAEFEQPSAIAVQKMSAGVVAIGAIAIGALAMGAFAVGVLAIGRLAVGRARIGRLEIDELVVRRRE